MVPEAERGNRKRIGEKERRRGPTTPGSKQKRHS